MSGFLQCAKSCTQYCSCFLAIFLASNALATCIPSYIADLLQIVRKHHYRKRTKPVVLAKVEVVHAGTALLDANYLAGDALSFI